MSTRPMPRSKAPTTPMLPLEAIIRPPRSAQSNQGPVQQLGADLESRVSNWHSLRLPQATDPSADLAAKIDEAFGSIDALKRGASRIAVRATSPAAGCGWPKRMASFRSRNRMMPIRRRQRLQSAAHRRRVGTCLLFSIIRNKRPAYLDAVIDTKAQLGLAEREPRARARVWTLRVRTTALMPDMMRGPLPGEVSGPSLMSGLMSGPGCLDRLPAATSSSSSRIARGGRRLIPSGRTARDVAIGEHFSQRRPRAADPAF